MCLRFSSCKVLNENKKISSTPSGCSWFYISSHYKDYIIKMIQSIVYSLQLLPFFSIFSRSDIAPLLSRGVASHIRLPGPLLSLLLWCLGADQQRSLRCGVSPCWLLRYGDWWVRCAGSLPVAATAAAVHSPAAESTTTAAADPTDPALPATAAPAVSATTGGVSPLSLTPIVSHSNNVYVSSPKESGHILEFDCFNVTTHGPLCA